MIAHPRPPSASTVACATTVTLLLLTTSLAAALDNSAWKHRQDFDVPQAGLVRLPLPIETLDLGRPALPDLRVIGPAGEEVPYLIEVARAPAPTRQAVRSFRVQLDKLATVLTLETGTDLLIEGVDLSTDEHDFVKAARVDLSADGERWELIGDGLPLSRGRSNPASTLTINRLPARFVRITVDDWRTLPVTFTGAALRLAAGEADRTLPIETAPTTRQEFARETVFTLDLPARQLPLARVEFEVEGQQFSRRVTVAQRTLRGGEVGEETLASGVISRWRGGSTDREQLGVALESVVGSRELQIHVENENSPPLAIRRITIHRRPIWLVIRTSQPGSHAILSGNPHVDAPRYDLEAFAAELGGLADATIAVRSAQPNPAYQGRDAWAETPLLGAPVDTANWKHRKTVTPGGRGIQELELDIDVLAHTQADLDDLRLVRDGRQVPFLLERTRLRRSLPLAPTEADDPAEPRISRWKLELPRSGVPISRLTLETNTALFTRLIQIVEVLPDRRGDRSRRLLGSAQWNSTPDRRVSQLTVELTGRPAGNELFIETDNADNPPITLRDIRAEYPVVRVLFRSEGEPVSLLYGADASAPRYDLALISEHILNEEKTRASAGPEVASAGGAGNALTGLRSGVLLWSALAAVVIVLLVVIGRLLPKPPAQQ